MGLAIDRDTFTHAEFQAFAQRIRKNLATLQDILHSPGFGEGASSIGAELEVYLVDQQGNATGVGPALLAENNDRHLTHELNRYNLEYNLDPVPARGRPFSVIARQIDTAMCELQKMADAFAADVLPIGILPTLKNTDLCSEAICDVPRYRALSSGLLKLREGAFTIRIDGTEPLTFDSTDVAVEGANTSFQIHWRINPADFTDAFNALQLVTPLALALAGNSPTLLGHLLWEETRIALFKQSVDSRGENSDWHLPARVPFGFGWLRQGAYELFAQTVALYEPLLAIVSDEDCQAEWQQGKLPSLGELRLHHGSVWPWNRAIYDPADGGHLRIEMRAMPAGPSAADMAANAALLIGLAHGLSKSINTLLPALPYAYAEHNFYRAAQFGLNARLIWPTTTRVGPVEKSVADILAQLWPLAEQGLDRLGVESKESQTYLGLIKDRLGSGQTGAVWQRQCLRAHETAGLSREDALHAMLTDYQRAYLSAKPVSEWSTSLP